MDYSEVETKLITLEGFAAIEYAEAHELTLSKYNDTTEDAHEGLTPDEARAVAREDSRLIYLTLSCTGWTEGDGTGHDGYNVADYFVDGVYQGPDAHGIEPIMEAKR